MLSIWCQTYIHLHSGPAFYVDSSCRGMILSYWHSKSIKYTRKFDLGWKGQKAESSEQRCQCHLYHFSYSKAWRACGLFGETPGGKRYEAHAGSYVLMIYVTTFAEGEAENACEGSGTKGSIVSARKKNEIDMQIGKWHATSMCLKCLLAGYLLLSACSARFATGNWEIQGTGWVVWVWLCFFLERFSMNLRSVWKRRGGFPGPWGGTFFWWEISTDGFWRFFFG